MVAMVSSSKAGSPGKTFVVAGSLTCDRLTRFSWSSRTGGAVAAWAVRPDSAAPNTPARPAASTLRLIGIGDHLSPEHRPYGATCSVISPEPRGAKELSEDGRMDDDIEDHADEGILDPEDTLDDRDELAEGYSPPER